MEELQQVIKGSLFLASVMEGFNDADHEHISLARKVAESVLIGTINNYRDTHGEANLNSFLQSIQPVELQGSDSNQT